MSMTDRRGNAELRGLTIAAALMLALLAAGCSTSPEPYFGWDTQKATPHRTAVIKPKPRPNPTRYAANRYDNRYDNCSYRNCDTPVPSARPNYSKYDQPARSDDETDYRQPDHNEPVYNANVRFQWPVRGHVLAEFGSYPGGERNNGINIATSHREPIRAAADGVVSYSGNELRGYGNLALIKHDNGYITAYAHADEFVVNKGDRVARGQVIGYAGQTGDVGSPQLHFELRRGPHGETPVDPRPYLGPLQVAVR